MPSNQDLRFSRNLIRHKVIPEIKNINPNIIETIYRESLIIDSAYKTLEKVVDDAYKDTKRMRALSLKST
jgi:tRNA(Ile)-lysidine synthase